MYGETKVACSEIHRSHSNTHCGQDADTLSAETLIAITRSNQVPFRGYFLEVSISTAKFNTKIFCFFSRLYLCDP